MCTQQYICVVVTTAVLIYQEQKYRDHQKLANVNRFKEDTENFINK